MQIQTSDWSGDHIEDIGAYVARHLDGDREGVAENAAASAEKASEALGRLVEILAEKNILSAQEVTKIARGYQDDDASFLFLKRN